MPWQVISPTFKEIAEGHFSVAKDNETPFAQHVLNDLDNTPEWWVGSSSGTLMFYSWEVVEKTSCLLFWQISFHFMKDSLSSISVKFSRVSRFERELEGKIHL